MRGCRNQGPGTEVVVAVVVPMGLQAAEEEEAEAREEA